MKSTIDLMVQHWMKVEYGIDLHRNQLWVRATGVDAGISIIEFCKDKKELAAHTKSCVKRLAKAMS